MVEDAPSQIIADGYARLSVKTDTSASIAEQMRRIKQEAARRHVVLRKIHVDDGVSGAKPAAERDGYRAWAAAAREHEVQMLIVDEMDRATRAGLAEYVNIVALVEETGVRLVGVSDRLDSHDPDWETRSGMDAVFAQRYRKEVQKKVTRRHARDRREGVWHGPVPWPYGGKTPAGKLVPDPQALAALREMIVMVHEGRGYRWIAGSVRRRGLAEGAWDESFVHRALRRPILAGWHRYDGQLVRDDEGHLVTFADPAALGPSEYHALQRKLDERSQPAGLRRTPAVGPPRAHPLIGLLVHTCGAKIYTDRREVVDRFRCRKRRSNVERCPGVSVPVPEVERAVRHAILGRFQELDDAGRLDGFIERAGAIVAPAPSAAHRAALDAVAVAEAALRDLEDARWGAVNQFAGRDGRYAELHAAATARLEAAQRAAAGVPQPLSEDEVFAAYERLSADLGTWARLWASAIRVGGAGEIAVDWLP